MPRHPQNFDPSTLVHSLVMCVAHLRQSYHRSEVADSVYFLAEWDLEAWPGCP
jgi:hypothetical protein